MNRWTEPNDSPIWSFIQSNHANLPEPIKQLVFLRLQETDVPTTDKIFPWVVVAVINRVIEELLRGDLQDLRREIEQAPQEIGQQLVVSIREALTEPVQEIRAARQDFRGLTRELRASAVLDASLSQSGWRGIGAAIGAIFRLENLMVVFIGAVFVSLIMGILLSNWVSARDRHIIDFNKKVIKECHQNYAKDEDKNGWYTCSIFQLPMPKK